MLLQKRFRSGVIFVIFSWLMLFSVNHVMAEGQSKFSQDFFKQVAPITMADNLAVALGAVDKGESFVYNYEDAVKLAGHSCLAVSGAYRVTQIALQRLYGEQTPVRGEIEVTFRGAVDHKINGPMSQVVTLITGAAADNGFKGFNGVKFRRYGLLKFDKENNPPTGAICSVIFKRLDTGRSIEITYRNNMLPARPDMQDKVEMVLLQDIKNMFVVTES